MRSDGQTVTMSTPQHNLVCYGVLRWDLLGLGFPLRCLSDLDGEKNGGR
jgi:hypothetical protein